MMGGIPRRPTGTSAQARFVQWVWDTLVLHRRAGRTPGSKVSSTTGGVFSEPMLSNALGGTGSRVQQYILTDASAGDYFVCRTLSQTLDPESETLTITIGANDIYIAKPFHLRQSAFAM